MQPLQSPGVWRHDYRALLLKWTPMVFAVKNDVNVNTLWRFSILDSLCLFSAY
jgi:hypothetical protein